VASITEAEAPVAARSATRDPGRQPWSARKPAARGAAVGNGAVVAVGALAHGGTQLPDEFFLAPGTIAIGDPPRIYAPSQDEELAQAIKEVGFAARAFGVTTAWQDRAKRYRETAEVRSREFATQADDEIINGEPPID
jgi:hypothetical protein